MDWTQDEATMELAAPVTTSMGALDAPHRLVGGFAATIR
jgi:hypothetical protein